PVAIVPNGVDLPEALAEPTARATTERIVLSLGRIHPKKALDRLVRAWAIIEAERPGWRLRIVGPGEAGYDKWLRALVRTLGLASVSIEGPIYGDAKFAAYRDA